MRGILVLLSLLSTALSESVVSVQLPFGNPAGVTYVHGKAPEHLVAGPGRKAAFLPTHYAAHSHPVIEHHHRSSGQYQVQEVTSAPVALHSSTLHYSYPVAVTSAPLVKTHAVAEPALVHKSHTTYVQHSAPIVKTHLVAHSTAVPAVQKTFSIAPVAYHQASYVHATPAVHAIHHVPTAVPVIQKTVPVIHKTVSAAPYAYHQASYVHTTPVPIHSAPVAHAVHHVPSTVPVFQKTFPVVQHVPTVVDVPVHQVNEHHGVVHKTINVAQPAIKTRKYEVRRPAIQKQFYDIEERIIVRPAGSVLLELDQPLSKTQKSETVVPVAGHGVQLVAGHPQSGYLHAQPVPVHAHESGGGGVIYADEHHESHPTQPPHPSAPLGTVTTAPASYPTPTPPAPIENEDTIIVEAQGRSADHSTGRLQQHHTQTNFVPNATHDATIAVPTSQLSHHQEQSTGQAPATFRGSQIQQQHETHVTQTYQQTADQHLQSQAHLEDQMQGHLQDHTQAHLQDHTQAHLQDHTQGHPQSQPVPYMIAIGQPDFKKAPFVETRSNGSPIDHNLQASAYMVDEHHSTNVQRGDAPVDHQDHHLARTSDGTSVHHYSAPISEHQLGANQQQFINLLLSRGSVSEVGFGGGGVVGSSGSAGLHYENSASGQGFVRTRVVAATPAPHNADPAGERVHTRRIVVSHPIETIQEIEVQEPVTNIHQVTVKQPTVYKTASVGLNRVQTSVPVYVNHISSTAIPHVPVSVPVPVQVPVHPAHHHSVHPVAVDYHNIH